MIPPLRPLRTHYPLRHYSSLFISHRYGSYLKAKSKRTRRHSRTTPPIWPRWWKPSKKRCLPHSWVVRKLRASDIKPEGNFLPANGLRRCYEPGGGDPNTPFLEFSPLAAHGMYDNPPSAGIVTGIGLIQKRGREAVIVSNDATTHPRCQRRRRSPIIP